MESYKNQLLSIYPLPNIISSKKNVHSLKNNNIVHFNKTNTPMSGQVIYMDIGGLLNFRQIVKQSMSYD